VKDIPLFTVKKKPSLTKKGIRPMATKEPKTPAAKKAAPEKKPNAAFMKALTLSPQLAAVIGSTPVPRTEVIKLLWVYIKKHGLQDAANKRMINADAKLKALFQKDQVSMFDLAKIVSLNVK
jgi:chromatin remodeling complex protein RSC6